VLGGFGKKPALMWSKIPASPALAVKLEKCMNVVFTSIRALTRRCPAWVVVFCLGTLFAAAQAVPASSPVSGADTGRLRGTLHLDGPWRFQMGDDPRWADPTFDDSAWTPIKLGQPINEQGIDTYSGYGWYRMHVQPRQVARLEAAATGSQLNALLTGYTVGQFTVFVNGVETARTQGMTDRPVMYESPPLIVPLGQPLADGGFEIAIRSWAAPGLPIRHGLVDKVELGTQADIADALTAARDRNWMQNEIAGLVVSFLFLSVALLGATLYRSQRHHAEYLWLTLLCLTVALTGAEEFAARQAILPVAWFNVLNLWMGRVFMAVTLEFVLRFTGGHMRRVVRVAQVSFLVLPFLFLLHLDQVYDYFAVSAEIVFTALVSVLLYRAWRRGLHEAGVMLLPFFLAATADSMDTVLGYAASNHWISAALAYRKFHLGPIEFPLSVLTYAVFLASLLAVILYRFIHVSQEEQRSVAEIEAARSVQAMLIPTELPSNHHFMLESAYLPANGVGGDFFQVLPLKDDSMLIVVGDVSGKGLQAAMNASTLVGALRNELSSDPATVLNRLNNVLLGATQGQGAVPNLKAAASFATCVCARVYPDGTMIIANAGHLHPYRDGRELDLAADLPLGVVPDIQYEQATFELKVGDRLIFLSDGVVEATNAHGELFGFERTQQVSNESARYIAQTAKRFGQNDDITVVSMYFASRSAHRVRQSVPEKV